MLFQIIIHTSAKFYSNPIIVSGVIRVTNISTHFFFAFMTLICKKLTHTEKSKLERRQPFNEKNSSSIKTKNVRKLIYFTSKISQSCDIYPTVLGSPVRHNHKAVKSRLRERNTYPKRKKCDFMFTFTGNKVV